MTRVERLDAGLRAGQQRLVAFDVLALRVGEVGEQGEVNVGVEVSQRLYFELLEQPVHAVQVVEQGRHDDHGATFFRDAAMQLEPGQPQRGHHRGQEALNPQHGQLAGGDQHQQRDDRDLRRPAEAGRVEHGARDQQRSEQRDAAQVDRGGVAEDEAPKPLRGGQRQRELLPQLRHPLVDQIEADVRGAAGGVFAVGRGARALHRPEGHSDLGFAAGLGEQLDGVPVAVAAGEVHQGVVA